MDDRAFASATSLAGEIRDRRIGCVELLDFYVARAERHNPALNAIVVRQVDQARERARAADAALARGERWGPLHGIPMTVKESFNIAALPTTFGNPLWKDNIPAATRFSSTACSRPAPSSTARPTCPTCWPTRRATMTFTAPRTIRGIGRARPVAPRVARRQRSPPDCRPSAPAATSPARCATRHTTAASTATNRAGV